MVHKKVLLKKMVKTYFDPATSDYIRRNLGKLIDQHRFGKKDLSKEDWKFAESLTKTKR